MQKLLVPSWYCEAMNYKTPSPRINNRVKMWIHAKTTAAGLGLFPQAQTGSYGPIWTVLPLA